MANGLISPNELQLERTRAAEELWRRKEDEKCKKHIISHKEGVMYWIRNLTRTENKQWQAQKLPPKAPFPYRPHTTGIDLSKLPFPHDFTASDPPDYLDIITGFLLRDLLECSQRSPELWIPKTREMMTSWAVMAFITWHCQFHDSIEWIGQSEDDGKAMGLVDYANILYREQPEWLRKKHPLKRGDEGTLHEIKWANSSMFEGLPSGERKMASKHPHGFFSDEIAHQPAAMATLDYAKPAVRQVVCVSSVAPGGWWELVNAAV